jgi:phosphoglucomutase
MSIHAYAGKPARPEDRINIGHLVSDYFNLVPDVTCVTEKVTFWYLRSSWQCQQA